MTTWTVEELRELARMWADETASSEEDRPAAYRRACAELGIADDEAAADETAASEK